MGIIRSSAKISERGNRKMNRRVWYSLLVGIVLTLCSSNLTYSQDTTGSIVGTVKDASGAVIAGATVTITDPAKNDAPVRTVTSNDNGEFSVPNLQVSVYNVTVEAPNFKKFVSTGVKVDVGQRRPVDAVMTAGNIAEVVTIEADPVSVDNTTPTAATTINGDQVRELSINNRNFVQLVTLAPGVVNDLADQVYVGTTNPSGQANTVNISVNGARSSSNTFTVDGADITDRGSNLTIQAYPSVDAIGEFKVLRSLFPAESGSSGGGQVNVVTRSGTDKFHGTLFEFVRNDKFNANDFLTNASTAPSCGRESNGKARRCALRYNNFGFTVGGPVYFLKFGEREPGDYFGRWSGTYFFFSEEQRKARQFSSFTPSVPDAALRHGVFPVDVCINLNNVAGSTCTGANVLAAGTPIPANLISPAANAYLTQIYNGLPPSSGPGYTINTALVSNVDFRQELLRIDHRFTDKLNFFYKYERDSIPTLDANALFSSGAGLPDVATTSSDSPGRAHTAQLTYVVTPKTIIEGRYSYSYGAILSQNIGLISSARTGIPITLPFVSTRDRIPTITGNGFSAITGFGPYDNFSDKHNWGATLTTIHGSHTLKFGANYSMYRKNENALVGDATGPNQGSFLSFSTTLPANVGTGTGQTLPAGYSLATVQNLQRWANFLIGNVLTFRQAQFDYTADLRQRNVEAFAQDEWRLTNRVTLYMGVRYSRFGQAFDKNGRLSNFIPSLYNASAAPQVTGAGNRIAGTGNFCNGMVVNESNFQVAPNCTPAISPYGDKIAKTPKHDFAPRVGLAWDPFGNGKTSIRTGYGIYHEQYLVGFAEQIIGVNPPYQNNVDFTNVRLDNPAAGTAAAPNAAASTIRAIQADWKTPYMQQWSLDVQHLLTKNTFVSIGYYGSKGTNLVGVTEINELPPGTALNSNCAPGNNTFATSGVTLVRCQPQGYIYRGTGTVTGGNPNVVGTTGFTDYLILDQIRPFKGYRSITMLEPRYNSKYHSLQFSAHHRFTNASQLNVAYTWSKALTDNQTDRSTAPQNTYDTQKEYARSALDRRHVFTTNFIYELPYYRDQHGLTGKILGGWQTSGIVTYQTGLPFSAATSSYDPAGLGFIPAAIAGGRPNVTCNPNTNAPHTLEQWFDISCFERNTNTGVTGANVPGNAGRGTIEGPRTFRVDLTLSKNIRFNETMRLQLRGEAFNIFNTTNFRSFVASPSSLNVTSANFGRIGAMRDPRTLQFGIKFYF